MWTDPADWLRTAIGLFHVCGFNVPIALPIIFKFPIVLPTTLPIDLGSFTVMSIAVPIRFVLPIVLTLTLPTALSFALPVVLPFGLPIVLPIRA